jgi:hypothetical protein
MKIRTGVLLLLVLELALGTEVPHAIHVVLEHEPGGSCREHDHGEHQATRPHAHEPEPPVLRSRGESPDSGCRDDGRRDERRCPLCQSIAATFAAPAGPGAATAHQSAACLFWTPEEQPLSEARIVLWRFPRGPPAR